MFAAVRALGSEHAIERFKLRMSQVSAFGSARLSMGFAWLISSLGQRYGLWVELKAVRLDVKREYLIGVGQAFRSALRDTPGASAYGVKIGPNHACLVPHHRCVPGCDDP